VLLLSGHFVKLVLVANLLAWPLAWYAMHKWLEDFAYRIDIRLSVFVLTAMLSVFIALITISFQSIKAAIANPVKSLRSE
jgi:putative ABC transport system permease protein